MLKLDWRSSSWSSSRDSDFSKHPSKLVTVQFQKDKVKVEEEQKQEEEQEQEQEQEIDDVLRPRQVFHIGLKEKLRKRFWPWSSLLKFRDLGIELSEIGKVYEVAKYDDLDSCSNLQNDYIKVCKIIRTYLRKIRIHFKIPNNVAWQFCHSVIHHSRDQQWAEDYSEMFNGIKKEFKLGEEEKKSILVWKVGSYGAIYQLSNTFRRLRQKRKQKRQQQQQRQQPINLVIQEESLDIDGTTTCCFSSDPLTYLLKIPKPTAKYWQTLHSFLMECLLHWISFLVCPEQIVAPVGFATSDKSSIRPDPQRTSKEKGRRKATPPLLEGFDVPVGFIKNALKISPAKTIGDHKKPSSADDDDDGKTTTQESKSETETDDDNGDQRKVPLLRGLPGEYLVGLVMEMGGRNLLDFWSKDELATNPLEGLKMLYILADHLCVLQSKLDFIHRDFQSRNIVYKYVHPENQMLDSNKVRRAFDVKIIDFGRAWLKCPASFLGTATHNHKIEFKTPWDPSNVKEADFCFDLALYCAELHLQIRGTHDWCRGKTGVKAERAKSMQERLKYLIPHLTWILKGVPLIENETSWLKHNAQPRSIRGKRIRSLEYIYSCVQRRRDKFRNHSHPAKVKEYLLNEMQKL